MARAAEDAGVSNPWAADWPKPKPPRSIVPAESLIPQLDPKRDYGTRTYEQVVEAVLSGALMIYPPVEPGRQPVLRLPEGPVVKGSGPYNIAGGVPQTALQARLVDWGEHEGIEVALKRLRDLIVNAEPAVATKAIDVFFKYAMPKSREAAPDDSIAVKLLEALMTTREARPVEVYEVTTDSQ